MGTAELLPDDSEVSFTGISKLTQLQSLTLEPCMLPTIPDSDLSRIETLFQWMREYLPKLRPIWLFASAARQRLLELRATAT